MTMLRANREPAPTPEDAISRTADGMEDYSISHVVEPGTCADHILHALCVRIVDESTDGGFEPLPAAGAAMASDLLAEAESWLNDHHRCGRRCVRCPQCHPAEVAS